MERRRGGRGLCDGAWLENSRRAGLRQRPRPPRRNRTHAKVVSREGEYLMAQFRIPGPLRRLSGGQNTVDVEAGDLATAIEALDARYPGFQDPLLDQKGERRQFVNT